MESQPKKPPFWERASKFLERLHYAIGGVALGGFAAEAITGVALVRPEILAAVGVFEIGYGLVIGGVTNWIKNRNKDQGSAPAPAAVARPNFRSAHSYGAGGQLLAA